MNLARAGAFALAFGLLGLAGLASPGLTGEIRTGMSVQSSALGRPLPYTLYVPDRPAEAREKRIPTVYLLHGYGGGAMDWVRGGVEATADRLIEAGAMSPMLIVMPGAGNRWYVDNPEAGPEGRMATAIAFDLVEHIEATQGVLPERRGRALAGLSMGGFGALRLAYTHPDRFLAAAGLSAAIWPDFIPGQEPTEQQLGLFEGTFGAPFAPARFNAANVFRRILELQSLEHPPSTYLHVGDDDFFGFWEGNLQLFLELREAGLPAELRVTDGGHTWEVWARELGPALRFLSQHLESGD